MFTALDRLLTASEFLAGAESLTPTELLNGEIVVSPAPMPKHQYVSGELQAILREAIPHGVVFAAPIDLQLDEQNVVQPDLVWVAKSGACTISKRLLLGIPALVVEILSPTSTRRDRGLKFDLYQQFAVAEYWLVDPENAFIEVFVWADGRYLRQGLYDESSRFTSPALGDQTISLDGVFMMSDFE